MKKVLIIALMVLPFVVSGCAGCSGNAETKKEEKAFSLVGETYAANEGLLLGDEHYMVLRFIDDTNVEYTTRDKNPKGRFIGDIKTATYTLNYPKIVIAIFRNEHIGIIKYEGDFVDEKTFRAIRVYDNGAKSDEILEFQKQ